MSKESKPSDGFTDKLLPCPKCGKKPKVQDSEQSGGMEAIIQCHGDCNTVIGPTRLAVSEWNRQASGQES